MKDGRVFLLEFTSSGKKLFFWAQEPKEEKDDEFVTKVNQFINNPPAEGEGSPPQQSTPIQTTQPQSTPSRAQQPSQSQSQQFDIQNILSGMVMPQSAIPQQQQQQQNSN